MPAEYEYADEPLGVGAISQLNDEPCDTSRKVPLGFPIPGGEGVTPYRDRLNKGDYSPKKAAKQAPSEPAAEEPKPKGGKKS